MEYRKMKIEEIDQRLKELNDIVERAESIDIVEGAIEEKKELVEVRKEKIEKKETDEFLKRYKEGKAEFEIIGAFNMGVDNMENMNTQELELRAFKDFITKGIGNMNETEKRALDISGSAAVLPVEIMNKLITGEKWSDLLYRASVINQGGAGSIYIPIASNTAASWKIENKNTDALDATYEASPTLTKLELKGYELYRWLRISSAAYSMTEGNFADHMLQLLSGEVVETLEKSFISGSGSGQPKGLDNLTWVPDTNQILTAAAATPISPADIAEALSLLPQKYARNAVILCNSDMLYQISQFKGTSEYAYNMADGAATFLSKEIIVSEHMADDTIYIVDPKELYIRFAMPIQVEANRASGFTAAAVDLRALTVVDAVWNPAACVAVGLGS